VDATPPLPQLNKFDQQVLAVCGEFGARVEAADVRRLFERSPAVVQRIGIGGLHYVGRYAQLQQQGKAGQTL
jgi:hypothetical protein